MSELDPKIERLKTVRQSKGMNAKQFADFLEMDPSNYYQLESGKRRIGKNLSKAIVFKLSLNPDWWENGTGEMIAPKEAYGVAAARLAFMVEKGDVQQIEISNLKARIGELEKDKEFLQDQVKMLTDLLRSYQQQSNK